ncbi:TetR/AcrR family transcriptional regulator [Desulfobotulus sp. H1]|uniref:TetR/AcrR family transcriptional regulator n=1 Tax=Desulfobotulus pelophilus TaxID=2823377 RepID=A0ABT3N6H7_9BACT|nr:TetR/AcrR family transcriptional regulator [Desulfobotulus pelophilus]MCW7753058.1 TetR/AcrR family transcriptional regulator [Desulfobotulus pelophilus]
MTVLERTRGYARSEILDAATRLFLDKGVDKASLSDIASGAGVSKGTLHYHFASKNDLIFAITEAHMESITAELLRVLDHRGENPEELFSLLMTSLLEARTRGRLHLHLVGEAVGDNSVLGKRIETSYQRWEEMLSAALLRLFPGHRAAGAVASLMIAIIDGFIIQDLIRQNELPLSLLIESLMAMNRSFVVQDISEEESFRKG